MSLCVDRGQRLLARRRPVRTSYPRGVEDRLEQPDVRRLVVDDEHAWLRGVCRSCGASQLEEVADLLGKGAHADRLLDVPVEARLEGALAVVVHRERRHRDHRDRAAPRLRGSAAAPRRRRSPAAAGPSGSGRAISRAPAGHRPRPRSPRSPRSRSRSARPGPASGSSGCPRPPGCGCGSSLTSPPCPGPRATRTGAPTATSADNRSSRRTGLTRYAAAPSATPRARSSTIDTTITGMSRVSGSAFSAFSTAQPSMPGSRMSSSTASGRVRRTAARPD